MDIDNLDDEIKDYTVYEHVNKINQKRYIGITCKNPLKRWGKEGIEYLSKNKEGKFTQPKIARAILKYGWDNFEHNIIAEKITQKQACEMEIELIKKFRTQEDDYGYNIASGGISFKKSNETKNKIRISQKGRIFTEETKKKMSERHSDVNGAKNPRTRKVQCIETGEIFNCAKDAGLIYNNTPSNPGCGIRDACRNRRRTSGVHPITKQPLHWKFLD